MTPQESALLVLVALCAGFFTGRILRGRPVCVRLAAGASACVILGFLFLLGAGLGGNKTLFSLLPELGKRGAILGLCCTLGSALCALPAVRFFPRARTSGGAAGSGALRGAAKSSLGMLFCFFLGTGLARCGLLPNILASGGLTDAALLLLMLLAGMGLGFDARAFGIVRELGMKALYAPLAALAGTALGAGAAAALLPETGLRACLAVGAGFGYYSLSSVLITGMGDAQLGSVALIANIFRELLALALIPLLARRATPLAAVSAAGATAMDTCLPVIAANAGESSAIIALFSGLVLTLLVPFLVPLILL